MIFWSMDLVPIVEWFKYVDFLKEHLVIKCFHFLYCMFHLPCFDTSVMMDITFAFFVNITNLFHIVRGSTLRCLNSTLSLSFCILCRALLRGFYLFRWSSYELGMIIRDITIPYFLIVLFNYLQFYLLTLLRCWLPRFVIVVLILWFPRFAFP